VRKVRHVCDGGRRCGRMYLATVDWLTEMPNFWSSPWMRGAPQSGFKVDISRINARMSAGTPGRPVRCRLFHVQNKRKPRRCQARTVAGWTTWSAALQPCHLCDSHAHSTRSMVVKRSRGRRERFATANWCRSARISRWSTARERTKNWSVWSTETTTDTISRAYSERCATSIVTKCTGFLVATGTSPRRASVNMSTALNGLWSGWTTTGVEAVPR